MAEYFDICVYMSRLEEAIPKYGVTQIQYHEVIRTLAKLPKLFKVGHNSQIHLRDSDPDSTIQAFIHAIMSVIQSAQQDVECVDATVKCFETHVLQVVSWLREMVRQCKGENPALQTPALQGPALPRPALPSPALQGPALPRPALPSPALQGPALPSPALPNAALQNSAVQNPAMHNLALQNSALPNPALQNPAMQNAALQNSALQSPVLPSPALTSPALPSPTLTSPALTSPCQEEKAAQQIERELEKEEVLVSLLDGDDLIELVDEYMIEFEC
ncbi:uncharacterized protein LOC131008152 [Salvia miltiorrhiza]|uniref:uncharacterized protein LOC131008152 n=1 Tax=Salvia miltiorrhiza TaxID=226208 RepID=UPI0025ABA4A5|nr:uncharacterized protein LOC131008152 [Salvia miltiorrhiza]